MEYVEFVVYLLPLLEEFPSVISKEKEWHNIGRAKRVVQTYEKNCIISLR